MRNGLKHLFLSQLAICSFIIPIACLTSCAGQVAPIYIADNEKQKDTTKYDVIFNFNCEYQFYTDGISSEITNDPNHFLQIDNIFYENNKLSIKVVISNYPTKKTVYSFGFKFTSENKKRIYQINDFSITYTPTPSPSEPSIGNPYYTETTTYLLNEKTGGIEVKFENFKYVNISSIDNLDVSADFGETKAKFDLFIDAKHGNTFDIIIKSNDINEQMTLTCTLNFTLNKQPVKYNKVPFIIDVYKRNKPIPDIYYKFNDYEESGEACSSIVGYDGPTSGEWNCLDIPGEHIKDGKVYKVISIADGAFREIHNKYTGIEFLSFSRAVYLRTIGNEAFKECNKIIGDIDFPKSLTHIGKSAFEKCSLIGNTLSLHSNLVSIDESVFQDCKNISKINLFEFGGLPTWCSKTGPEPWYSDNHIFLNLSEKGVVFVANKSDIWKNALTSNCGLNKNWDVIERS